MLELLREIPDPDVLLALTPEELGRRILLILVKSNRMDGFSLGGASSELWNGEAALRGEGYPRDRKLHIEMAMAEAFAWLETHDLIIPDPSQSQGSGFRRVTRLGARAAWDGVYGDHTAITRLRRDMLHPAIAEDVWTEMARGDFSDAVFKAFRAVEIAVRAAAALEPKDVGVKLMQKAFGQGGALRDPETDQAEADALMHLFVGAIGSYKNPHSHRNVALEAGEAIEMVMLASHLLRIVEARRPEARAT